MYSSNYLILDKRDQLSYQKMEENTSIKVKLKQAETQQLLFMSHTMSSSGNPIQGQSATTAAQSSPLGYYMDP